MNQIKYKRFPALGYAANEAMNTLCTNLTFSGAEYRKILITSSHASEGKSFLSMNVARTLATIGYRVVLVDCDLRRSELMRRYFKTEESHYKGTSHYLAGMANLDDVLYETETPNMHFVPRGRAITNSLPLVSSDRMEDLLDRLAQTHDFVIVDAPPVGMIVDAARIAAVCDGTLLVVNYNSVRRRELIDTKAQIEQSGCPILGTVINQADFKDYVNRKYYNRNYSSYYKNNDDSPSESKKKKSEKASSNEL